MIIAQLEGEQFVRASARRLRMTNSQVDALASTREDYEQELRLRVWLAGQKAPAGLAREERERWLCVCVRRQAVSLARARAHRSQPLDGMPFGERATLVEEGQSDARVRLQRLRRRVSAQEWSLLLAHAGDQDSAGPCLGHLRNRCRGMVGRPEVAQPRPPLRKKKVLAIPRLVLRGLRVIQRRGWRVVRPLVARVAISLRKIIFAVGVGFPGLELKKSSPPSAGGMSGRWVAGAGPPGDSR